MTVLCTYGSHEVVIKRIMQPRLHFLCQLSFDFYWGDQDEHPKIRVVEVVDFP